MVFRRVLVFSFLLPACAHSKPSPTADGSGTIGTVSWSVLRDEIGSTICVRRYEDEVEDPVEIPVYGDREACGRASPSTAIERSIAAAFVEAQPILLSFVDEERAAFRALELPPDVRDPSVRDAFLTDAFLAVLLPRLHEALARQGLRCSDCPVLERAPRRVLEWSEVVPYVFAHVWPDDVVTPRDDDGRPTGEPRVTGHICGAINGLSRISQPDPQLVRAGFLAAIHTPSVLEHAPTVLEALTTDPEFQVQDDDDARTEYLRAHLGPRLLETPNLRADICETLRTFEPDTGVVVSDCSGTD
jgi:hypothetical protein